MKQTVTSCEFIEEMTRPGNGFSHAGAYALFQYLEQLEDDIGEDLDFDPVAIRVEFSEYSSIEEYNADSNTSHESWEDVEYVVALFNKGKSAIITEH